MRTIETTIGEINEAWIIRVREVEAGKDKLGRQLWKKLYTYFDGESTDTVESSYVSYDFDKVEYDFVIPAQPGFSVVSVCIETCRETAADAYREPIVAWGISAGVRTATPITVNFPDSDYAVMFPDGRVTDLYESVFESLEAYVAGKLIEAETKRNNAAQKTPTT